MSVKVIRPRPTPETCCGNNVVFDLNILGRPDSGEIPCVDTNINMVQNGDFGMEVFVDPAPTDQTWQIKSQVINDSSATVKWDADTVISIRRGTVPGSGSEYTLEYYTFDAGVWTSIIDTTIDQTFSVDLIPISLSAFKQIYLLIQAFDAGSGVQKHYYLDMSATPYGTFTVVVAPGDWVAGPNVIFPWTSEALVSFYIQITNDPGGSDNFDIDNVSLTHVECI